MYRCTICKAEFQQKPDFCDCGNDEFEVVGEASSSTPPENQATQAPQPVFTQTPQKEPIQIDPAQIISILIFVTCLVVSFLFVAFFDIKQDDTKKPVKQEGVQELKSQKIKPVGINSIWNDEAPKVVEQVENPEPPAPKADSKDRTKIQPPKAQPPVQKTPKKPDNIQPAPKKADNSQAPKATDEQLKKELKQYKIALRNRIASQINFAAIAGDGKCTVTFKISPNGQITNRTFSELSQNDMLNDNVFQGVSKLTHFNPPPEGYKQETLKLTVTISDGNFTVSLI